MSLASSSFAQLRYKEETVYGQYAGGNGINLRMTGETLTYAIQTDSSKEIRSDRQVSDLIQVGRAVSGGVNYEMSFKEYDPLIEATMMSDWVDYGTLGVGAALSLDIDTAAGTLTAGSAPVGVDAFTTLEVGQWFRLTAPGDAADGTYLMVGSVTSTVITVDASSPIPGVGARAGVANCQVAASRIKNGSTYRSFTFEKTFTDVAQSFIYYGCTPSKMSMSFESGKIVGGMFDFLGSTSERQGASIMGSATASQSFDVMNAISGVGNVWEAGAPLAGTFIQTLKLNLDNKLRGQTAIGVLGNADVAAGRMEVTGEITVYLANGIMYDKFVNNLASSISWYVRDGYHNGYVFTLPKVKYSDAKVQAGGLDQDVILTMPYSALLDPTTDATLIIDRLMA